jgi:hypothetical protein
MKSSPSQRSRAGRSLTAGEIAIGRSVFGDAIDYDRVRIYDCKWHFFMPNHRAHAPNGHVYFPVGTGRYCEDFAVADLHSRSILVHELAHVWQHQNGVSVATRAMLNRRYDYAPVFRGVPFSRLGVEAQAKMVADWYLLRHGASIQGRPPIEQYERALPAGFPAARPTV